MGVFDVVDIIQLIKFIVMILLSTQFAHGLTVVIMEKTMLNYYLISIFDPPENSFQKFTNFIQNMLVGSSYFIYTKISKYNWFVRKILFIIILFVQGILSIVLYYIIALPLDTLVEIIED